MDGGVLLPEQWQTFLKGSAESGMGYQTGDVTLNDGSIVRDVVFLNPYIGGVRGHAKGEVPFKAEDIARIELTHKRWKWE